MLVQFAQVSGRAGAETGVIEPGEANNRHEKNCGENQSHVGTPERREECLIRRRCLDPEPVDAVLERQPRQVVDCVAKREHGQFENYQPLEYWSSETGQSAAEDERPLEFGDHRLRTAVVGEQRERLALRALQDDLPAVIHRGWRCPFTPASARPPRA